MTIKDFNEACDSVSYLTTNSTTIKVDGRPIKRILYYEHPLGLEFVDAGSDILFVDRALQVINNNSFEDIFPISFIRQGEFSPIVYFNYFPDKEDVLLFYTEYEIQNRKKEL